MDNWFDEQVALVTGAANGIGKAAAILFAKRGAKVVVTDVQRDGAEHTAAEIRAMGHEAVAMDGDVTQEDVVVAFVDGAIRQYRRLDCAFNNAGTSSAGDEVWDEGAARKTLEVNLFGVMRCMRHEIRVMLQAGGGVIVNTASIVG